MMEDEADCLPVGARIISSEIMQELKNDCQKELCIALRSTFTHRHTAMEREARTNEAVYIGILFHSSGLLGARGLPITLKRQSRKSKCFYYSSSLM